MKTAASKSCLFARPSLTGCDREYDLRRWSRCLRKPTLLSCSVQNDLTSPVVPCSSPPRTVPSLPCLFLLSSQPLHLQALCLESTPHPHSGQPPRVLLESAQKPKNSLRLPLAVSRPLYSTGVWASLSPTLGSDWGSWDHMSQVEPLVSSTEPASPRLAC